MYSALISLDIIWKKILGGAENLIPITGAIFLSVGLYFYLSQARFEQSSQPVSIKIVKLKKQPSEEKGRVKTSYEITEGKFSGRRYTTKLYSSPSPHQPGDLVQGRFNPKSGEIQSNAMAEQMKNFSILFMLGGLVAVLFGFGSVIYHRYKKNRQKHEHSV